MEGASKCGGFEERFLDHLSAQLKLNVLHHHVWVLDRLGTVDGLGLHHTLIKTQRNFSTDSCPSHCNYGGNVPLVCCCCSNLSYTTLGAGCRNKVSAGVTWRNRERLGKLCNILLEERKKPRSRALSWYLLACILCEKDFQSVHGVVLVLASQNFNEKQM